MLNVIDYAPGNTALHKLHPVAKVALAAEQRGFYLRTRESSYRPIRSPCAIMRHSRSA